MLRKDFVIAVMILSAMMAAIFSVGCTGGSGSQQVESMVVSEAVVEPTSVPTAVLTPSASSADASGGGPGFRNRTGADDRAGGHADAATNPDTHARVVSF